ncbi:hypothetical protein [Limnohabitans sp. Rim8]|uniref:hypothetical protein n=1 Tax=Limnohabitans sp. Rim8 TaxID=1100718 RepID=UPI0026150684|nr:hypothetical protein [Limnohabitans sp. Rim8]
MIFTTVRNLITAIALVGFAWAAQSQINVTENSKKTTKEPLSITGNELSDPVFFRDMLSQSLGELTRNESAVLLELRKGYERLSKSCSRATPSKPPIEDAALSRNILAFEQARAVISARQDALVRSGSAYELAANRLEAQYCLGLPSNLLFDALKSPNCKQAQNLQSIVKIYRTGLSQYYQLQSDRYRTYLDLATIEQQGCVRSGFTSRLLLTNDGYMKESEEQSQRMVNRWDSELNRWLRSAGVPP